MRFLPFVLQHLRHTWVRTGSTAVAMGLCVFLFCTLQSVLAQFNRFIEGRSPRRLIVRNGIGILSSLPFSHGERIKAVPGVSHVAATLMFGGLLPARKEGRSDVGAGTDWTTAFSNTAVDAAPYFAMQPELIIPEGQFRDFMDDLRGCVIGRGLSEKFGWRIGDRFHLESFAAGLKKPSGPFEFVVRAIYDVDPATDSGTDTNQMFFHFHYLSESLGWPGGARARSHLFTVGIADPSRAADIAAEIDALFENSGDQTFTESERAFTSSFISMIGDLGAVVNGIGLAVCFTILLVTANTMSMAVRERRTEVAVLKTLGFRSGQVMGLIVAEALVLGALGGLLGVAAAQAALWTLNNARGITLVGITNVQLRLPVAAAGVAAALLLGLAAGFMPAFGAYRARAAEMLRSL